MTKKRKRKQKGRGIFLFFSYTYWLKKLMTFVNCSREFVIKQSMYLQCTADLQTSSEGHHKGVLCRYKLLSVVLLLFLTENVSPNNLSLFFRKSKEINNTTLGNKITGFPFYLEVYRVSLLPGRWQSAKMVGLTYTPCGNLQWKLFTSYIKLFSTQTEIKLHNVTGA